MIIYEKQEGDYLFTTDKSKMDIHIIHHFLATASHWAIGIPMETVQKSVDHSYCFAVLYEDKLVGFARMITDYSTFSYLADVFILPAHRGKGLSKTLVAFIHTNPELAGQRRWMLSTKDAHSLYTRFGWALLSDEQKQRIMQIHISNAY